MIRTSSAIPRALAILAVAFVARTAPAAPSPATAGSTVVAPATQPDVRAFLDLGLEPPPLNARPGPEYAAEALDYGMVIGMDRTPKGRVWACWVAGGDNQEGFFVAATSDDGGATWSKPRLVVDPTDPPTPPALAAAGGPLKRRALVGNFWTDPAGRLWLFVDQSVGYFDGRAGVWAAVCDNPDADAPTWSAPTRIWHGCTLNKPTVLKSGEWLLPVSLWPRERIVPALRAWAQPELDADRMAHLFVSTDQGKTWARRGGVRFPGTAFDEHMTVELRDGRLWMLARTTLGHVAESFSTDAGRTWSDPQPSVIKHTSSRFHIRRLASGKLLLVKNGLADELTKGRRKMTAQLSEDDGKTWRGGLVLDERTGVSYPDGFQSPDGLVHVLYDRNRAKDGEVLMAKFREADVVAGRFASPDAREKVLVSKPLKPKPATQPAK